MTAYVPPMDNTSTCEGRGGTSSHESVTCNVLKKFLVCVCLFILGCTPVCEVVLYYPQLECF